MQRPFLCPPHAVDVLIVSLAFLCLPLTSMHISNVAFSRLSFRPCTQALQELLTKAPLVESSLEASQIQGKLSVEESQVSGLAGPVGGGLGSQGTLGVD